MEKSIIKPKITLMFLALLMIIGTITFFQLPKREIPEFTFNIGTIMTVYPGATPETVERVVTVPIEDKLLDIDGIKEMSSVSAAGISTILLQLEDGVDKQVVFAKVRQSVSDVSNTFSDEIMNPTIREDVEMGALTSYHLLSNDREILHTLGDTLKKWQSEIEAITGVRGTIVKGVPEQELVLALQSEKLVEKGIHVGQILNALNNEFKTIPLGTQQVDEGIVQLALQTYESIADLEKVFVGHSSENETVYLSEVGTVEVRDIQPRDMISFNGIPALSFTVLPEKGVDIPSLQKQVDERLAQLKSDLPDEVALDLFYTQNTIVSQIFKDLSLSFAISIIAVILITLLGMNIASAMIVALAIPISILLGLIPLPYVGVDLNQISIIGFIIALGILVDDAIVVNDNIQRRYSLGDDALTGAINGTKEVRVSIITSTLAVVFTFLPLVFLSGGNGDFIRALPTVLITTIIASTLVSLTIVPIYSKWRKQKSPNKKSEKVGLLGNQLDRLANWYSEVILRKVVKKPLKVSIIGLVVCTLVYGLVPFIPVVFFPSADREEVTVDVVLPVGNTLDDTNQFLTEMATTLNEDEAIKEVSVYSGAGLPGLFGQVLAGSGDHTGQLLLRVDKAIQSADDTIAIWTPKLQEEFPLAQIKLTTIETGPPAGAPIAIKVSGPDIKELMGLVDELKERIEAIPGSGAVIDDVGEPWPTIEYVPNRDLVAQHGISLREISEQIRIVTDGLPLGTFDDGYHNWNFRVVVDEVKIGERLQLEDLYLPSKRTNPEPFIGPELIALQQLVEEVEVQQIQKIPHVNGERTVTLRAYPGDEQKAALESEIKKISNELSMDGYTIKIGGENEARTDFFIEITKLFFIVIFLIYIVMAIQFYSLVTPLLVMSTVYLAISGAIIGLFVTQVGLGFMAMMGIVSLAGIVVRNSIVLIEFIEQRLAQGLDLHDAVVDAGRTRLRPILLTAFTAVAALIPLALSGDVLFRPLAISIISGLLFSTILTVILVPAFYTLVKGRRKSIE